MRAGRRLASCLTPDRQLIVLATLDGETRFISTASGATVGSRQAHREGHWIESCCVSPDSRWLVTGDGRAGGFSQSRSEEVVVWDLATREVVHRWQAHDRRVGQMLFGPGDDELATYGWDKCVRRWRVSTGELLAEYPMGRKLAVGLGWTDDQRTLVAVDADGDIWRWSIGSGEQHPVIRSREGQAHAISVNARDQTLLISLGPAWGDRTQSSAMKFIDMRTWETKTVLTTAPGAAAALDMSRDGSTLLVGNDSGHLHRWQVQR